MNRDSLTLADVARFPRPGTVTPSHFSFTPGGDGLTFLDGADGSLVRELFHVDLATGLRRRLVGLSDVGGLEERAVSPAEALLRERLRRRETGITDYRWAAQAPVMVLPQGGVLRIWQAGALREVALGDPTAELTPDGRTLVYTRDGALYAQKVDERSPETRLAFEEGRACGVAEYVAQEEMHRYDGFWISPDGAQVAYTEVDDAHIPALSIPRYAGPPGAAEVHRYPFAGAANARVRLWVVPIDGGRPRPVSLPPFEYLARVMWTGPQSLLVQLQPRDQRSLDLLAIDLSNDGCRLLRQERSSCWVNLHDDARVLGPRELLWSTEDSGHRHLVVLGPDGAVVRRLTEGAWAVDRVVGVAAAWVYFLAGKDDPTERQLYRVPVRGGAIERNTEKAGFVSAIVHPAGEALVVVTESGTEPPAVHLSRRDQPLLRLQAAATGIDLPAPERFTFPSRDGVTLHGALHRPAGPGPWPLVVSVYGGPHVQVVQNTWAATVDLRAQHLAARGYAVLRVDNRGSARRGLDFEGAIYRRMGTVEIDDQVDGVRHLIAQGLVDPARVGVYGWSYGGYASLLCLARAPELFRAAVSGAPVTEWEGYDTHYTERYMATPAENPEGYAGGSVIAQVGQIRGRLLLVHGLVDENVHFRHAARLIDAMVKAGVEHELLLFPDERHMPRSERDRAMMEARLLRFFDEALAAGAPQGA